MALTADVNLDQLTDQHRETVLDFNTRTFSDLDGYVVAVVGDQNSQKLTIVTPRYYDNIDLSGLKCNLVYWTSWVDDSNPPKHSSDAIELSPTDQSGEDKLYYTWVLDKRQTAKSGQCLFKMVWTDSESDYKLSTKLGDFIIVDSGMGTGSGDIILPDTGTYSKDEINKMFFTKEEILENSVGQKTSEGGEIFNNYEDLIKDGEIKVAKNIAGINGFRILNTTFNVSENKAILTCELEDTTTGLEINDVVSLRLAWNHIDIGTITSIENNVVTIELNGTANIHDASQFTIKADQDLYPWYNTLVVNKKPDIGNIVVGLYAHAEGLSNKAYRVASHAEGWKNVIYGDFGHAEGVKNIAHYAAHAEGTMGNALGSYSHTEGVNNTATGEAAHAEGYDTVKAIGKGSHAEGHLTTAQGDYSHAEGNTTIASGISSHAEGESTTASEQDAHAEGGGTTASGKYSHAEGYATSATKDAAHAEGNGTQAKGNYSHAEGKSTTASGNYSHAEGQGTLAEGVTAHAEGNNTQAKGPYSHAEGNTTYATVDCAHAEGSLTHATGAKSHAEGYGTTATGEAAHAEGQSTTASGVNSHAEGLNTKATKPYSHAECNQTEASGTGAHAEGYLAVAKGSYSHAEGIRTSSESDGTHAEGQSTVARGLGAHAEGYGTAATAEAAHAGGLGTKATTSAQTAIGKYNAITDALFVVGNGTGTDDGHRSNVFEVYEKGYAEIESTGNTDKSVVTKGYVDEKLNSISNALKGTLTGAGSVIATDVSPIKHELTVQLISPNKTVNVFDVNKITNVTVGSGSLTNNGDGTLTISNTTYVSSNEYMKDLAPKIKVGDKITVYYEAYSTGGTPLATNLMQMMSYATAPPFTKTVITVPNEMALNNAKLTFMLQSSAPGTVIIKNLSFEIEGTEPLIEDFSSVSITVNNIFGTLEPQTYTANADGTVTGVMSVAPSMVLAVSEPTVQINAQYNRDINAAFAQLRAAIISLGGNV